MRLKITQFAKDHYYHFYNHAVFELELFKDNEDFEKCISLFYEYIKQDDFSIISYCLMPNHYHILLFQKTDRSFACASNKIWYIYTCYYNKKYARKGTLFANKLQHICVSNEAYLLKLCAYIHLNPVSAKIVSHPSQWRWSNYKELINNWGKNDFDENFIRNYFPKPDDYQNYICGCMKFDEIKKYFLE